MIEIAIKKQKRINCTALVTGYSQRGDTGGGGHAPVVEAPLAQPLLQAAGPLYLTRNLPRIRGLQLGTLGAHLLVRGCDVVLAELAVVLGPTKHTPWRKVDLEKGISLLNVNFQKVIHFLCVL